MAGYVKAGSTPSLLAGVGSGGALGQLFLIFIQHSASWLFFRVGYAGVLINQGQMVEGHGLATAVSTALLGAMGPRALRTGTFMPAGLVAILGAASAAYHGKKGYEWYDAQ